MSVRRCRGIAAGFLALLAWAATAAAQEPVLYQVSTIDALLAGVYTGSCTVGQVLERGDFGLGTFHGLDGEMVVLGGVCYQVRADGSVHVMPPDATTPFAAVTFFRPQQTLTLKGRFHLAGLTAELDRRLGSLNLFYAVGVTGAFEQVRARSVPAQQPPYPRLVDVVQHQSVFRFEHVTGDVVGLRCPGYVAGVGVPGFHMHFLMDDRTAGGHVLDLRVIDPVVRVMTISGFQLDLPTAGAFLETDLSGNRAGQLQRVEK